VQSQRDSHTSQRETHAHLTERLACISQRASHAQGQHLLTANASPASGKAGMRFWLSSIQKGYAPSPKPPESSAPLPGTSASPNSRTLEPSYSIILSSFNMSQGALPVATSVLQGELLFYGSLTYDQALDKLLVLHTTKLESPQDALEGTRIEGTRVSLLDPDTLVVVCASAIL
jgi:hypothetical protein